MEDKLAPENQQQQNQSQNTNEQKNEQKTMEQRLGSMCGGMFFDYPAGEQVSVQVIRKEGTQEPPKVVECNLLDLD